MIGDRRRLAAALLLAVPALFLGAACAAPAEPPPPAAEAEAAPAPPPGSAIVVWHWWTNRQAALQEAAAAYAVQTGESVVFVVCSPDGNEYYNKVEAAVQAGTLPDVIGLAGGGERLARLIRRDAIRELTGDLAVGRRGGWAERFFDRALVEMAYREGNPWEIPAGTVWGIPLTVMDIQIVYNKDLFAAAGLDPDSPPADWEAWLEAGRKLNSIGVTPFGYGVGDLWMNEALLDVFAWACLGDSGILATYAGGVPYTDPRWVKALGLFEDLRREGFFPRGIATAPNKDAEVMFTQGEIGMAMNGSWSIDVYRGMNPAMEIGVFPIPTPPNAARAAPLRGGVGTALAVTSAARDAGAAVRFLKWLTEPAQAGRLAAATRDLSAVRGTSAALEGPLAAFQVGFDRVMPALPTEERRRVWDCLARGVQSILIGRATAVEIAAQAAAEKAAAE